MLVPVGQARCLYQACPTGSGKGQDGTDMFHRGYRACPATRTGLQSVYMTFSWDCYLSRLLQGRALFQVIDEGEERT